MWLFITTMILLTTSEILSSYYGKIGVRISKKRLRNVALGVSTLFLGTVAIQIYLMIALA
jgi:hypothetical protein